MSLKRSQPRKDARLKMDLQLLKTYALSLIGTPYFYGGDDPISGIDCSGLASELLRAAGLVAYNWRGNAQQIYDLLCDVHPSSGPMPGLGAFAFFGKDGRSIVHVGFCLDHVTMIESGGGDHTTKTIEIASRQNAFVRLRPIRFRKDFFCCVTPLY